MFINKSFYKYNILILIYFLNGKLEKPTKNYFSMFTAFYKKSQKKIRNVLIGTDNIFIFPMLIRNIIIMGLY